MSTFKLSKLFEIENFNVSTFEPLDSKNIPNIFIVQGCYDGSINKYLLYNIMTKKTVYTFMKNLCSYKFKFVRNVKEKPLLIHIKNFH